ncbi:MAG: O-antigen ligase family protein [Verrucomicrobiota bacterium]|jgi:hypothetical protein
MNSPNQAALFRTLIIYAICVPLAITIGYLLTNPMDYSTFGLFGIVALLLASPFLLRWHHPLLILSWNAGISMFFIKSSPNLWLVMVALSLGISVLERALNSEMRFIRVPQITWPLLCLIAVVLVTAELTGGFGVRAFGSEVYGGRKYVYLVGGILSYFALTARRIPLERAGLYVALFLLGGVVNFIGDLFSITPSWARFVFLFFSPDIYSFFSFEIGETRLAGFALAGLAIWSFLMARYGIRGIFLSRKVWRPFLFFLTFSLIFLGGFRYQLLFVVVLFALQFFAEGLHRTKLLPIFAWLGIMAMMAIVPVASKLPFTFQRTLTFLPLHLDPDARREAQDSLDWRINMWKALLPKVPQYLLLGKGMAISPEEFNEMMGNSALAASAESFDPSQNALALSYDYHNGPLSVIIPFGIWGCIAVLWLLGSGLRVMYCNFRYGDSSIQTINIFLFAEFMTYIFQFLIMGGALSYDIAKFAGALGLSIALNGGVCRPAPQPLPARETFLHPQGVLPGSRPRPAFPQ